MHTTKLRPTARVAKRIPALLVRPFLTRLLQTDLNIRRSRGVTRVPRNHHPLAVTCLLSRLQKFYEQLENLHFAPQVSDGLTKMHRDPAVILWAVAKRGK